MTDSHRPSLPPSSESDGTVSPDEATGATTPSTGADDLDVPEPFREAVDALREEVEAAAETIRNLRAENARLRQRIDVLLERPDVSDDDAFILLEGKRVQLRDRIQQFIDAIDDHLATSPESGIGSEWPENPPEAPQVPDEASDANGASATANASEDGAAGGSEEMDNAASDRNDNAESNPLMLQDGLPDDRDFEVEVPDDDTEEESAPVSKRSPCRDDYTSEPRTVPPGLQPRRSSRRRP
mgnify:FL=1